MTEPAFSDLALSEPVLRAISHVGFKRPTPIQTCVIPVALEGRDVIGLAQTGSGKTAAFVIPMAERLTHDAGVAKSHAPAGLILCPTREIALQTKGFLDLFGKHHSLQTTCVIGGVKMGPQVTALKRGVDIVVGTPGRITDHLHRRTVDMRQIRELVLDEADRMLDMGFLPQIEEIMHFLPSRRHTMMFSATMPPPIERLARRYLADPERVNILPEGRTPEGITHRLYLVERENKRSCLLALVHEESGSTLVFTRTKVDADWLCGVLTREGHPVTKIHSNRSQKERVEALAGFREGEHRILVATDIASRGIDIPAIGHIINFDVPETVEEYIHRAGRTARIGASGTVSTIATWFDRDLVKDIEKALGKGLPRCTVPGVEPYVEMSATPFSRKARRRRR